MIFSFKNKLTLIFSSLIVLILIGCFWVVQKNITDTYTVRIKKQLKSTEFVIGQRMDLRKSRLIDLAGMLEINSLIQIMMRDPTLDRPTRDDIITDEILTNFNSLKYVMLLDGKSNILATNPLAKSSEDHIRRTGVYKDTSAGSRSSGYFFWEGDVIQLIGHPIFDEEIFSGALIIGFVIDDAFMKEIKTGFDVDLLILKDGQVAKSTFWIDEPERSLNMVSDFNLDLARTSELEHKTEPFEYLSHGERFIYYFNQHQSSVVPPYVLSKSLDKELAFVDNIRNNLLYVGIVAIIIGLLVCYVLSTRVTRPINQLQAATRAVQDEKFTHRVEITSKDEFAQLGASFNSMIEGMAEKEKIRGVLNKSVSKEIAEELLKENLQLGGEKKKGTILFADIRGFTALSESMDPKDLLNLINGLFTIVSRCVDENKGVIDKYMGDAVMAIFGVPLALENDAQAAVKTAIEISARIAEFNAAEGKKVSLGIGLNTGEVVAGNMGAEHRMNYTVMGDEVNLASRIEGLTKVYQTPIILTGNTRDAMGEDDAYILRELDQVRVKGKEQSVRIYDVIENKGDETAVFLKQFKEMISAMHAKTFDKAYDLAEKLRNAHPADGPVRLFAERIGRYKDEPTIYSIEYHGKVFQFHHK